jgi:hypothetical protein
VQVRVYVVVAESVADIVPDVGRVPLHPPEAVQSCAPLAAHCRMTVSPSEILVEDNWKLTDGFAAVGEVEELVELVAEPAPEFERPSASPKQPARAVMARHPKAQPARRTSPL